ncbi:hypothetical protein B0O99DRAFT_638635 [Bisporella sp. PMI_857]|nr:hypothetical protein B0O99DRAFT_638635 [Bisporella sp. PMI_857]
MKLTSALILLDLLATTTITKVCQECNDCQRKTTDQPFFPKTLEGNWTCVHNIHGQQGTIITNQIKVNSAIEILQLNISLPVNNLSKYTISIVPKAERSYL